MKKNVVGEFRKSRWFDYLALLCGVFMVLMPAYYLSLPEVPLSSRICAGILLFIGVLCTALIALTIIYNRRVFLRIGDDRITGLGHWGGKLDRNCDEIEDVQHGYESLVIRFRDGRKHIFYHLTNGVEIGMALAAYRTPTHLEESALQIREKVKVLRRESKRLFRRAVLLLLLLILGMVFGTILLSGKMEEYTTVQWIATWASILAQFVCPVLAARWCIRGGELFSQYQKLRSQLWEKGDYPLQPGELLKTYYRKGQRITLYRCDEGYYLILEALDEELCSKILERTQPLPDWDDMQNLLEERFAVRFVNLQ